MTAARRRTLPLGNLPVRSAEQPEKPPGFPDPFPRSASRTGALRLPQTPPLVRFADGRCAGQRLRLVVPRDKLLLFDAETEERVSA
jgi:hypothetical protein